MPIAMARSYAAGPSLLVLDGEESGFLKSFAGGAISADVIEEPSGASPFIKKHIGQPKYEDISLGLSFSMRDRVYEWISDTWAMQNHRRNGAVVACGFDMDATSRLEFFDGLITETTIPACDAASKDAAFLRVKVSPELIRLAKASGQVEIGTGSKQEQKMWVASSFRLDIEGLDCSRVSKVDAFTVKQHVLIDDIGEARIVTREPSKIEFPNLRITLSESHAQSWLDWHDDFVVKGNCDDAHEREGHLAFLSPNQKDELARIRLFNLGIFRVGPDATEGTKDQIKRITAELYCERMTFEYPKGFE